MARGYALSHGENLQGNNSSFAKSLALDFERAKEADALPAESEPWKRHPLYLGSRVIQQSLCKNFSQQQEGMHPKWHIPFEFIYLSQNQPSQADSLFPAY